MTWHDMADVLFKDRRLAEIYDPLDPFRGDLNPHIALAHEHVAHSVRHRMRNGYLGLPSALARWVPQTQFGLPPTHHTLVGTP